MTRDQYDALHRCVTPYCTADATHRVTRFPVSDHDAAMARGREYRSLLCDGHTARILQLDTAARAERLRTPCLCPAPDAAPPCDECLWLPEEGHGTACSLHPANIV